jgi:hypothetical protein
MSAITYQQAKQLTLSRLQQWKASLPPAEADMPRFVFENRTWSINAMIAQVQMDSDTGRRYVYQTASYLGYVISG